LNLNWSEGNVWKAVIPTNDNIECKFVFLESNQVKKWEGGSNRRIDLDQIINLLDKEKIVDEKISIEHDNEKFVYEHATSILTVKCLWKN
jgi:hypothetical protein